MKQKKIVRVRAVMKVNFDLIDGLMTVEEVLQNMQHSEPRALIVKKRHSNDEYGMLLFSDIAKQVIAKDRSPARVNIYEIMNKPVLNVDPEMDIRYCARLFERFDINRAPVLENGTIIGIISYNDMVLRGLKLTK